MRYGHDLLCPQCLSPFFVCPSCFRCQKYCSPRCKKAGYVLKQKLRRKKHAATQKALESHRERNKTYRVYGRQRSMVMDGTSDKDPDEIGFTVHRR